VAVFLVRHARALSRSGWEGDDSRRPLSKRGREQARLLVEPLLETKPLRLLSSPYLRCLETVGPLASAAGLGVEAESRLAEGYGRRALELVRSLSEAGEHAVLCSHGDVIPDVLAGLALEDGVDLGSSRRVEKASVWALEGDAGRFSSARYWPPPKRA
jgi:8-oxo-dGTP diphosphatase